MDPIIQRECLICGYREEENIMEIKDHSISGQTFILRACKNCGFISTKNPPEEQDCAQYYKSETYISHSDIQSGIVSFLYHRVRQIMLTRKANLLEHLKADKSILDVGSGTGYFPAKMAEIGYKSMAVEPDQGARSYSQKKFNLDVKAPDWIFENHGRTFGFITLWHVLEHIYEPKKYFSRFNELLMPDGFLIIALPNHTSYDAHHYKEYWAAYDVPRHLWHFNPDTFSLFAEKNGFTVFEMKSLPFDSFYNCILSETYKKTRGALLMGIIHGLLAFIRGIIDKEKTSSIIYILKKNQTNALRKP
jgi:SAM-dependent methyltransferase